MATKIGVLDIHQAVDSTPVKFLKKSVAQSLVRRLFAKQVSHNIIQLVEVRSAASYVRPMPTMGRPYIPTKMPMKELPGLKFRQSVSALVMQSSSLVTGIRRLRQEYV